MASVVDKLLRWGKRRIKKGLQDHRTWRLYEAGHSLFGKADYDAVSVAAITKEAGVSVGAFYERFKTKDDFLKLLSEHGLDGARSAAFAALRLRQIGGASSERIVRAIVAHTVDTLNGPIGGVVKAGVKRGQIDERHLRDLCAYRTYVADLAVALLKERLGHRRDAELSIRAGVQVVQAAAIDTLHHDSGVLRRGRGRMVDQLTAMMLGHLQLATTVPPTIGEDAKDEFPIEAAAETLEVAATEEPPHSKDRRGKRGVAVV